VLETAPDGVLVTPDLLTTTTAKYQVPAVRPFTTALVAVAPATGSVEVRVPALLP